MATATKKSRARRQVPRHAAVVPQSAAITFLVSADSGAYPWVRRDCRVDGQAE